MKRMLLRASTIAVILLVIVSANSALIHGAEAQSSGDGIRNRFAVMINGAIESRFWNDVTFMYSTLIEDYYFTADNIYVFNYDGTNPDGENPDGMIDYPATKSNLEAVFNDLSGIIDGDDLLFVWVTNHGYGYSGPSEMYYGYLDGHASVDPDDEQDYLESDFKLRSLFTGGSYRCNHGMDIWKVRYEWSQNRVCFEMYRNKFVSSFTDVYVESPDATFSDSDLFMERFVDYLAGDTDRDGYIEESQGEVYDYDGDGNLPYTYSTETFDEDDWGNVDILEDDVTHIGTQVPGSSYIVFDAGLDNHLDIDIDYNIDALEVDGTDIDNLGLFDGIDVNDDGDMDDWVSIDEKICLMADWNHLLDDEMAIYLSSINAQVIPIFMEQCFSGGFIDDLSGPNRVISTATTEEAMSYGNTFVELFTSALHWATPEGEPVNADSDGNGLISMLEAFNYAAVNDPAPETPQYDDNGDGVSHAYPVPSGGDGDLGAATYLAVTDPDMIALCEIQNLRDYVTDLYETAQISQGKRDSILGDLARAEDEIRRAIGYLNVVRHGFDDKVEGLLALKSAVSSLEYLIHDVQNWAKWHKIDSDIASTIIQQLVAINTAIANKAKSEAESERTLAVAAVEDSEIKLGYTRSWLWNQISYINQCLATADYWMSQNWLSKAVEYYKTAFYHSQRTVKDAYHWSFQVMPEDWIDQLEQNQ